MRILYFEHHKAKPLQYTIYNIIVFINILCGKKIYYINYSRLFSHCTNSINVVQSIKNIFKHSGVAEIQLGVGAPVTSPWGCGGTLTH